MKNCPHCDGELTEHSRSEGAGKAGAFHCPGCGCCFRDGKQRDGVPLCEAAGAVVEPPVELGAKTTPTPIETVKGGKPAPEGEQVAPEDSPTPERPTTRKKAN